ncbi:MAG: hypothetical protein GXY44_06480, partial [Phycisphaerales bacterium]|nr:hypothetical protein [Phycisphaerales bacterium]
MTTSRWTIGRKLIALSFGLVVVPITLIGGLSLRSLDVLDRNVTEIATTRLQESAEQTLSRGVRQAHDNVIAIMENVQNDTRKLAQSGTVTAYIEALNGENESWNRATRDRCDTLVRGFVEAAQIQNASTRGTLQSTLSVAELLMTQMGEFQQTDSTIEWNTINQLSREQRSITLPVVMVGDTEFVQNFEAGIHTPLVDDIVKHVGGTATLFQRINASGDMLRIATSVIGQDGKRAIGTYIPANNPDGTPNPVVSALLRKDTYVGRAFVVNQWYLTTYKPILNSAGELQGALYVGIPEQSGAIVDSLNSTKIGETGYPFVMNSKGELLVHPRSELVGRNTISDLKLVEFQEALDKRKQGEYGWIEYRFDGRLKFIAYSYFPEWDWVICASGYMDEMSASAAQQAILLTQQDMLYMYNASMVTTPRGDMRTYSQIRFLDATGKEVVAVVNGQVRAAQDLQTRQGESWFEEARKLPAGQLYVTPVELATNTGEPEVRVAAPVYVNNTLQGVVVVNADWGLVWERLSGIVFGKTGYPYVINEKGVLISHPSNTLKTNNSLADARYGALAEIVRNRMLRGEEGFGQYEFEGAEAYAAFTPLKLGANNYAIAARVPVEEFFEVSNEIQTAIGTEVATLTRIVLVSALVLIVVGVLLGVVFARSINRSLTRIATQLREGADQVNDAAGQVSTASQSLAEGASEQASSLEETSSALEEMAAMTRTNAENSKQ